MGNNTDFDLLPSVDAALRHPAAGPLRERVGHSRAVAFVRLAIAELRRDFDGKTSSDRGALTAAAAARATELANTASQTRLRRVLNATGVVLHTNLGRAPLAPAALAALQEAAGSTNVELDLPTGVRRDRGHQLEGLLRQLTGAKAALIVNNCAAATMLALRVLAPQREVVVSRGQLIEIGGSYRLPDVFREAGAILREVGTTNRTRLADYAAAIGPETAALLRAHPSNFRVVGFVEETPLADLAALAHAHNLPLIDDLGSGCLHDLTAIGLPAEPRVQDSVAAGADLALFSGDKLLGGPQCGIIVGRREAIAALRASPLARALRPDKLTLAALQATLEIHASGRAWEEIPALRMLAAPLASLATRAAAIVAALPAGAAEVRQVAAAVGGGSAPGAELPGCAVALAAPGGAADELARRLRIADTAVLGRIELGAVLLDLRSVLPEDDAALCLAAAAALSMPAPAPRRPAEPTPVPEPG